MAKKTPLVYGIDSAETKKMKRLFKFYYENKFFNKWMDKYDYPELNYQQKHYIMKKFWCDGTISAGAISSANPELAGLIADGEIDMKENAIFFAPWTTSGIFNIYDFPVSARFINKRNVSFIPDTIMKLDEGIVLGWAQPNHKGVLSSIEAKLLELVDVEMKKRTARKAQSQPWLFVFSPEDEPQIKKLAENIENDNPYLFLPSEEPDRAKSLTSGATYIVDKLEQDRQKIENDILTILGVNNVGIGEKKEHLIVDEVNANNNDITQQSESFKRMLQDFFDRIEQAFGYHISIVDNNEIEMPEDNEKEDNENEVDV